jgi:isoleucyl-tRNA synthetase
MTAATENNGSMPTPTRVLNAKSWSSTLKLPKSSFPARPTNLATYLQRCTDDLYAWQSTNRASSNKFVLHDGPPYANGSLHVGHALNKIGKDILCRFQLGQGKAVQYIPGWDCHGLPIEIKALQAQKGEGLEGLSPLKIREAARELATHTVEEQKNGFKQWGVMGDWENAYKTLEVGFEMRQLEVFKKLVQKGEHGIS